MYNIEEIKQYNNAFLIKEKKLEKEAKDLRNINNNISLDEVNKLSYEELKEIINIITYRIDKDMSCKLKEILNKKKVKKYPELEQVHYFPEIKKMDWLSESERIKIDKTIAGKAINRFYMESLDDRTIDFLIKEKVIKKEYIIGCSHTGCFSEKYISTDKYEKIKKLWEREDSGDEISDEEYKECGYGSITINCELEDIEISSIEDFKSYGQGVYYSRIKEPDKSLDAL